MVVVVVDGETRTCTTTEFGQVDGKVVLDDDDTQVFWRT